MSDSPFKVLIADDDEDLLKLIELTLHREGLETEGVLTGAEAIKHVIESPPCLFLLDFGLLDMTGKEVIEKLDSKKINVPFIIMTGRRDERVTVQMMKLGAVDYLTKDESFIDRLPSVVNHAVELLKDGTGLTKADQERRHAEEALRESREQLHSVFTNLQDVFYRIDREGRIILLSPSAAKMLGYASTDQLIGRDLAKDFYVHPEDRHAFLEELSKKGNVTDYEIELKASDGSTVIVSTNSHYYRDKNGEIAGVEGICRDITRKKKTEEELERHREHLMELVEERTHELQTSYERLAKEIAEREFAEEQVKLMALFAELNPSPVLRFNIKGRVLMANPAAIQMFSMGSLAGMPLTSLLPGIEKIDFSSCIRNGNILSHTVQVGRQHLHFIFRGIPHLDIGHLYGSDITEQKKAEDETIRASHLASLGELASGVAHEINNPINGIINYTQILLNKSMEGSREQDIFRRIIREGDRIAGIISSLLSFARDNKRDKAPVHIHEIMSESLALTGTQLKKDGISLKVNIPADLPLITAHSQQIEQVFLNLISNARYALSQKYPEAHKNKSLDINAKKVRLDNKPYMEIVFHDTGIGIPAENKSKVINPFFTTKPGADGTGLGLSISHGIINDHGGRIEIDSVEGEFTKVIINLPLNT